MSAARSASKVLPSTAPVRTMRWASSPTVLKRSIRVSRMPLGTGIRSEATTSAPSTPYLDVTRCSVSSRTNSGFPSAATATARNRRSVVSLPAMTWTSSATASAARPRSSIRRRSVRRRRSATAEAVAPPRSVVRTVTTIVSSSSSGCTARKARSASEPASAQCTSSSTRTVGPSSCSKEAAASNSNLRSTS